MLSVEQAEAGMDAQPERIGLIGHSHVALFFVRPDGDGGRGETRGAQASDGALLDLGDGALAAQPRQRRPAPRRRPARRLAGARHRGEQTARFHRVEYDIDRAAAPIVAAGLPSRLADRLYIGQ